MALGGSSSSPLELYSESVLALAALGFWGAPSSRPNLLYKPCCHMLLYPSQATPGVGAHPHTPGHHGDTQGWGAPDLSDDQEWAPAPTYPWASPFVLNISTFAINRQPVRGTLWLRSDVSLIPIFYRIIHECGKKFL